MAYSNREAYKRWYERNRERIRAIKSENMRRYRRENPEKHAAISRASKRRLRELVLDAYGRKCVLCGFSDERALSLDHVLNNGAQERAEIGERGVYLRSLKTEHRHEYRTLCMNCQFISRSEGGHQNQHGSTKSQQWCDSHGKR